MQLQLICDADYVCISVLFCSGEGVKLCQSVPTFRMFLANLTFLRSMFIAGPDPPYNPSICLDGVNKLGHFASSGTASSNLQPRLTSFFGKVEQKAQELEDCGG